MVTNDSAVVYNIQDDETFIPITLVRVMWQESRSTLVSGNEFSIGEDMTRVYVPQETIDLIQDTDGLTYVRPEVYAALMSTAGFWTVRPAFDYISRGATAYSLPDELHLCKGIRNAAYKDFGSRALHHIEIFGR